MLLIGELIDPGEAICGVGKYLHSLTERHSLFWQSFPGGIEVTGWQFGPKVM